MALPSLPSPLPPPRQVPASAAPAPAPADVAAATAELPNSLTNLDDNGQVSEWRGDLWLKSDAHCAPVPPPAALTLHHSTGEGAPSPAGTHHGIPWMTGLEAQPFRRQRSRSRRGTVSDGRCVDA